MTSPDAYDSTPQRTSPPEFTRLYRPRGARYAHLESGSRIICGGPYEFAGHENWLGTGNQHEYEVAARLPLCPQCFRVREGYFADPRLGTGHGQEMT
jgi:hypothetical protein